MIRRALKWTGGLVLLLAVVTVALALLGKKTFHVEVFVPAPPTAVWAVLTDAGAYPEWNPVFVKVVGKFAPGAKIMSTVKAPGGQFLKIEGVVETFRPGKELRQSGGMVGLLTFDHQWLLVPVKGGTKVIQHEVDRGLLMWFWDSSWIVPAYNRVNQALRDRVMRRQRR